MQRLRSLHTKNRYTQVSNDAIDGLPDLNSLGLLTTYLRHHDDFDFDLAEFIKAKKGVGKAAVYKARTTLISYGYIVQVKFQHSYRGRFATEIYRAAEPHTDDDLGTLREEYAPGRRITVVIGHDDQGHEIEQQVVIRWTEITSFRGVEVISAGPSQLPLPEMEAAKAQVGPDSAFPESGQPESGRAEVGGPASGRPTSGAPESQIEEEGEDDLEPDRQTDSAPGGTTAEPTTACLPGDGSAEKAGGQEQLPMVVGAVRSEAESLLAGLALPWAVEKSVIRNEAHEVQQRLVNWTPAALTRHIEEQVGKAVADYGGPGAVRKPMGVLVEVLRNIPDAPAQSKRPATSTGPQINGVAYSPVDQAASDAARKAARAAFAAHRRAKDQIEPESAAEGPVAPIRRETPVRASTDRSGRFVAGSR